MDHVPRAIYYLNYIDLVLIFQRMSIRQFTDKTLAMNSNYPQIEAMNFLYRCLIPPAVHAGTEKECLGGDLTPPLPTHSATSQPGNDDRVLLNQDSSNRSYGH